MTPLLGPVIEALLREFPGNRRDDRDSFRLFHGRGKCYPGLDWCCVDYFDPLLLITLFRPPPPAWESDLLGFLAAHCGAPCDASAIGAVAVQRRYIAGAPIDTVLGVRREPVFARRKGQRFQLSFDHQNLGFFLDIEPARRWLEARAVGQRVLNLFAYTCSFSVVAVAGGAVQVVNIDMSKRALATGRDNHRSNNLTTDGVHFFGHDIFKSWGKLRKYGPYNLVVIDPPSFQKGSFVASKDYQKVLRKMDALVAPQGWVLACLNTPEVQLAEFRALVDEHCPEFVWRETLAPSADFPEAEAGRELKMLVYQRRH